MIMIGISFLIMYAFFNLCLIGSLSNIEKQLQRINKRHDEIIRIIKNK